MGSDYDEDDYISNESDEDEHDIYEDEAVDDEDDEDAYIADDIDEDKESMDRITEKNFIVLEAEDIRKLLQDEIAKVSSILFVSREAATILLCNYNWDVDKISEEWFANEEKVRQAAGLLENYSARDLSIKEFFCGICLENHDCRYDAVGIACGHLFCKTCWKTYISTSVNDGRGCLMLRCPEPKCRATVGEELIYSLASDEDKEKYNNYLVRSYIEDRKKTKWCPAPGCDCAVYYIVGSSSNGRNFDVTCNCSYGFCWNCLEVAHSPVDCDTTGKWIVKNSSEAENTNWILTYTKPCPKCKKPIEKNQGCMHMTCKSPCNHHFCWLCLGPWSAHGERTGGYYACNAYERAKQSAEYDEDKNKREMAKNSLRKYTHYYERWAGNEKSRKKALKDLKLMEAIHLEKLSEIQGEPETELQFIIRAWAQIVECRRVLKWTYAYGYYLPEDQHKKKGLFEYIQGEAEAALERLHQCAETELQKYFCEGVLQEEFNDFRHKLVNLTGWTGYYFDNLVRAIGNDLILNCQDS
ncbi:probable E3 ubiquitin-protein ligase ARI8 [Coffea eugenioides]|uniref:probable E3 ubiquitin-protein ligase ARI8 n=1 Tax=Coffea eugenioides TaxID=49369 RepID=UPI000F61548F|nr:probable E3 ubiquitin-protein ligase ARI8 [Coffea eugenioides]